MTDNDNDSRLPDRGQVGIGTLIVFIAMVLVAAIAAGVLLQTAGFLQSKAEQTGEESTKRVTDRVTVISGMGNVTYNSAEDRYEVTHVNLTVMKSPGAGDVNLSTTTVQWLGPRTGTILTNGSTADADHFAWETIRDTDGSAPVLADKDDRLRLVLNTTALSDGLKQREEFSLKIITSTGAVTHHYSLPQSMHDGHALEL